MVEVAPGLSYAGVASRFVAYVLDAIILAVVSGIIAGIFAASLGFGRPFTTTDGFQRGMVGDPIFSLVSIGLGAAYFILSWSGGRRATPGQRLLNIQVGNAPDGRPLTTEQAARRWLGLGEILGLLAFLPGLIGAASGIQLLWALVLLITTAMSATKQGLHDRFANSMVVRPTNAGNGLVMACLVIVILLIVLSIVAVLGLIAVGSQVSDILRQAGESV